MSAEVESSAVAGSGPWWRDRQTRHARRRPRAEGLTIERITEAALAIVDRDGLDTLTVRQLADHLGTGSASLYRHIASREELLVLLVDHVIGEVRFPPPEVRGRERIERLAGELRRVLMAHGNLLPALAASPLLGPNALRGAEEGLASLLDAGFAATVAVPAQLALIDYVLGTVYFDTSRAGRAGVGESGPEEATAEMFDALPAEGFSTLRSSEPEFAATSVDEVFEFGLAVFLDGLERRFPPDR